MVADTDTVVGPGAVMIVSLDAHIAHGTMLRARCPNYLAISAKFLFGIEFLKELNEVEFLIFLKGAGVFAYGHHVGDEHLDTDHAGGYGIVPSGVVGEQDKPQGEQVDGIQDPKQNFSAGVSLELGHWGFDHRPFEVSGFFLNRNKNNYVSVN